MLELFIKAFNFIKNGHKVMSELCINTSRYIRQLKIYILKFQLHWEVS